MPSPSTSTAFQPPRRFRLARIRKTLRVLRQYQQTHLPIINTHREDYVEDPALGDLPEECARDRGFGACQRFARGFDIRDLSQRRTKWDARIHKLVKVLVGDDEIGVRTFQRPVCAIIKIRQVVGAGRARGGQNAQCRQHARELPVDGFSD
ncbi:hypothetical protein [Neoaquamicrobium sediminum]|uniref:hypothetical protein n=1 Tax=Neoaquamicrobium sediminum TaxID=1849104 RepID=UPI001FD0DDFC|nr:hypothetical protein [Mesorhizobium sediminum]